MEVGRSIKGCLSASPTLSFRFLHEDCVQAQAWRHRKRRKSKLKGSGCHETMGTRLCTNRTSLIVSVTALEDTHGNRASGTWRSYESLLMRMRKEEHRVHAERNEPSASRTAGFSAVSIPYHSNLAIVMLPSSMPSSAIAIMRLPAMSLAQSPIDRCR
ncbi:hypothetical protein MRB53_036864 [Persea americana]|nr:hypothetical protein MRB53_036864 [Persea americana]